MIHMPTELNRQASEIWASSRVKNAAERPIDDLDSKTQRKLLEFYNVRVSVLRFIPLTDL